MGDQLDQLCAMFEGLDREVVAVVLESCGQSMDRSIDQLLQINADQEAAAKEAAEAERVRVAREEEKAARARERAKWRKPIPEDFLKLPSAVRVRSADAEQIERDQLVARLLADEGFRRELVQHDEFRGGRTNLSQGSTSEDFDWGGTWQGLTEAARIKFDALATKFSRSPEYQPIQSSSDDSAFNAMFPSGGTRNRSSRSDDNQQGTEMQDLGSMSRMKIQ